jgi:hypothetical protein
VKYDLTELVEYLDGISDLTCMVYNETQKIYLPHGRDWIKSRMYISLKRMAKKIETPEMVEEDMQEDE